MDVLPYFSIADAIASVRSVLNDNGLNRINGQAFRTSPVKNSRVEAVVDTIRGVLYNVPEMVVRTIPISSQMVLIEVESIRWVQDADRVESAGEEALLAALAYLQTNRVGWFNNTELIDGRIYQANVLDNLANEGYLLTRFIVDGKLLSRAEYCLSALGAQYLINIYDVNIYWSLPAPDLQTTFVEYDGEEIVRSTQNVVWSTRSIEVDGDNLSRMQFLNTPSYKVRGYAPGWAITAWEMPKD